MLKTQICVTRPQCVKKFHVKHLNCELYYKFPEDDPIVSEHVAAGPNPGRQRIVDVAVGRRRSSNLGQDSEVNVAYSSNNSSYGRYMGVYYVRVSELPQGVDSGGW